MDEDIEATVANLYAAIIVFHDIVRCYADRLGYVLSEQYCIDDVLLWNVIESLLNFLVHRRAHISDDIFYHLSDDPAAI